LLTAVFQNPPLNMTESKIPSATGVDDVARTQLIDSVNEIISLLKSNLSNA